MRNGLMIGVRNLEQQLAASERTCAELRAERDEWKRQACAVMKGRELLAADRDALLARAEAAERTVEGYKSALSEAKARWFAGVKIETLPDWIELRATELAQLKGDGGE